MTTETKLEIIARSLEAIANAGLLNDEHCKNPIKAFIRQATETSSWHATAHWRSKEVSEKIRLQVANGMTSRSNYQKYCSENFRHEHVVPCEVIYKMLIKFEKADDFIKILEKYSIRATITISQDNELNRLKLKSKMPEEFNLIGNRYYEDPFARYKAAGFYNEMEDRGSREFWI